MMQQDDEVIDLYEDSLQVNEAALPSLERLAQRALELQAEIVALDETRAQRGRELNDILARDLPAKLAEARLAELTLESGHKITLKDIVEGGVPKDEEKRRVALDLVRRSGHRDIIKNELTARFAPKQDNVAQEARAKLKELGVDSEIKESIHPQTFLAWARECYARDSETDGRNWLVANGEKLGLFVAKRAVVNEPKKKRA